MEFGGTLTPWDAEWGHVIESTQSGHCSLEEKHSNGMTILEKGRDAMTVTF